jgi:acetoin utilization deacetylase AcuC-like enzyme
MNVSNQGFGYMGRLLGEQAVRSAKGRIALVLEGGYDLVALEEGLVHSIEGAFEDQAPPIPSRDSKDVTEAAKVASRVWKGIT